MCDVSVSGSVGARFGGGERGQRRQDDLRDRRWFWVIVAVDGQARRDDARGRGAGGRVDRDSGDRVLGREQHHGRGVPFDQWIELNDDPSHIRLVNNEMRDMSDDALDTHQGASDIWFVGNQVQNIRFTGDAYTGYGIQTFGGPINGLHVNYNTFDMGGASADAMQLGDVHDFEIIGNVITNVRYSGPAADPHADAIMLWDGASRGLVKDNRITDSMTTLWSGSTSDVRLENNLIARMRGWCHDGGPTGTSSAGLVRYTWVRNTIYDCGSVWNGGGFGGTYGLLTRGPATAGASSTLSRNLLTSLGLDTTSQFAISEYNLIKNGALPGASDRTFTPQFTDLLDYRPTNLPAGYENVGYRYAPAGDTVLSEGDLVPSGGSSGPRGPSGPGGGSGVRHAAPRCAGRAATVVGTAGRDVLRGTRRADVIVGLGGRDLVNAARGNDIVCAGAGNDTVAGGRGRDRLRGGPGRDRLKGGPGKDRLGGGGGRDICRGGSGRDRAVCEVGSQRVS